MENKKITDEMRAKLKAPLPAEAVSQHPTKTYLSSIKAIYVTERMNDVFGVGAWRTKVEFVSDSEGKKQKDGAVPVMVVVKLTFEIPEYGVYYECYGGNDNADRGDAYKGATTDALTKVGSFMEIGIDVFKGKASNSPKTAPRTQRTGGTGTSTPKQQEYLMSLLSELNRTEASIEKKYNKKLPELTNAEASEAIEALKKAKEDREKDLADKEIPF